MALRSMEGGSAPPAAGPAAANGAAAQHAAKFRLQHLKPALLIGYPPAAGPAAARAAGPAGAPGRQPAGPGAADRAAPLRSEKRNRARNRVSYCAFQPGQARWARRRVASIVNLAAGRRGTNGLAAALSNRRDAACSSVEAPMQHCTCAGPTDQIDRHHARGLSSNRAKAHPAPCPAGAGGGGSATPTCCCASAATRSRSPRSRSSVCSSRPFAVASLSRSPSAESFCPLTSCSCCSVTDRYWAS